MTAQLSGFDGKVAVVTGAGRMRSIGRTLAAACRACRSSCARRTSTSISALD
jgi:hypothetical protein